MSNDAVADAHGCVDITVTVVKNGRILLTKTRNYPRHLKIEPKVLKEQDLGPSPKEDEGTKEQ